MLEDEGKDHDGSASEPYRSQISVSTHCHPTPSGRTDHPRTPVLSHVCYLLSRAAQMARGVRVPNRTIAKAEVHWILAVAFNRAVFTIPIGRAKPD
jgi:hypothetical protein